MNFQRFCVGGSSRDNGYLPSFYIFVTNVLESLWRVLLDEALKIVEQLLVTLTLSRREEALGLGCRVIEDFQEEALVRPVIGYIMTKVLFPTILSFLSP